MYLLHSFVESDDIKNIYDGVVILDSKGKAQIQLPGWVEAVNKEFRYQLTAIATNWWKTRHESLLAYNRR